jgi:hypothetical protein
MPTQDHHTRYPPDLPTVLSSNDALQGFRPQISNVKDIHPWLACQPFPAKLQVGLLPWPIHCGIASMAWDFPGLGGDQGFDKAAIWPLYDEAVCKENVRAPLLQEVEVYRVFEPSILQQLTSVLYVYVCFPFRGNG